jgi:hypothetical protein
MHDGNVSGDVSGSSLQPDRRSETRFKYNEDVAIEEIYAYIASTYGQHYANGVANIQTFDAIMEFDGPEAWRFFRGCAFKYLWRFGKKQGFNRADLLKAIHYIILLMNLTKDRK